MGLLHLFCMLSVIFVEPESPGNIGSIARCMMNFGAEQLILVSPVSLEGAQKMAMHAQNIIDRAIITETLADALALVDTSIATSSESSGLLREALTPDEVPCISGHIGVVIGRESSGLTNEEIEQCDFSISIPTSDKYSVMNAASACCILLYELFKCTKEREPARREQKEKILEEFDKISEIIEKRKHRKRIWRIVVKKVISKAFLTHREATVLLGLFRRTRKVLESTLSQKH